MMTDKLTRLEILKELLSCVDNLSMWQYNSEMVLLNSNSPQKTFFDTIFAVSQCRQQALEHCRQNSHPVLLTNTIGMAWIALADNNSDGVLENIYVIGPVFTANTTEKSISQMAQHMQISVSLKLDFLEQMKTVPTVMISAFCRYGAMLYYCLTGQKMDAYDMLSLEESSFLTKEPRHSKEMHGTWTAEQMMLRIVEEGDENHQMLLSENQVHGQIGKIAEAPLRQCKNELIIWIALCARAAIRGGLEVETAFTISDYYIQSVEESSTTAEAYSYSGEMFDTLVRRVSQLKKNNYSRAVSACIDYVKMNLWDKIDPEAMAQKLGYTTYYLTTRFKKETGKTLNSYINEQKVEMAKLQLIGTEKSLTEISEDLHFSSQNYFGSVFKKFTGMTPGAYRESKGKNPT